MNQIVDNIQNPPFCSMIIWRFICGYYQNNSKHTPLPLLFIVLPLALREDIAQELISTQKGKGLLKFLEKFVNIKNSDKKNDFIVSINSTAIAIKPLTLDAIRIGISTNLFTLEVNTACCFPLTITAYRHGDGYTQKLLKATEKFGYWCSDLTLHEISRLLKVRF